MTLLVTMGRVPLNAPTPPGGVWLPRGERMLYRMEGLYLLASRLDAQVQLDVSGTRITLVSAEVDGLLDGQRRCFELAHELRLAGHSKLLYTQPRGYVMSFDVAADELRLEHYTDRPGSKSAPLSSGPNDLTLHYGSAGFSNVVVGVTLREAHSYLRAAGQHRIMPSRWTRLHCDVYPAERLHVGLYDAFTAWRQHYPLPV